MTSSRAQKIIQHARKFGFLNDISVTGLHQGCTVVGNKTFNAASGFSSCGPTIAVTDYGPFGSQMRKHVLDSWWKYSVMLQDGIFPLVTADRTWMSVDSNGQTIFPFRIRAENNYQKVAKLLSNDEVGIAQIMVLPAEVSAMPNPPLLLRSPTYEYLTVHHFCHSKQGSALFNDIIKSRLRWWKRFSNRQANFNHQVKESNADNMLAVAEIIHDCPSGKSSVERVSLGILDKNGSTGNFVESCTIMEIALSAFLEDGFEERVVGKENGILNVLRLHPNIAPIKTIVLVKDTASEEQSDLADRLSKEVKIAGITCHKLSLKTEEEVYDFADAIGTPFCLKIDAMTLRRGIVGLRHRDTTVHEFMHISEVTETLAKVMNL